MLDDSRCTSVDSGTIAVSSRLLDESEPAEVSTPMTVNVMSLIVTVCPTGSSAPNSSCAVVGPSTTTVAASCSSAAVMNVPDGSLRARTVQPLRRAADDRRRPVGAAVVDLQRGALRRRDGVDVRRGGLRRQRVGVVDGQRRGRAEAAAHAAGARGAARRDDEQVAAQRVDLVAHRRLRALAQPDGQHHRGDADQDAEHRQPGTQPVRADRLQTGAQGLRPVHADTLELGLDPRPSSTRTVRLARGRRRRASCVISTIGAAGGAQLVEQVEHVGGGVRVEVARGLVGQDHRRLGDERARDRDALLLSAGQLARPVVEAVAEPDAGERLHAPGPARSSRRSAGVDQRQLDVAQRGQRGQQVELLEDEADAPVADLGELVLVEVARRPRRPAGTSRSVATSRQPRMCMSVDFPEPDGPMIATYSPARDVHRDAAQRLHLERAAAIDLADVAQSDDRLGHRLPPPGQVAAAAPGSCRHRRRSRHRREVAATATREVPPPVRVLPLRVLPVPVPPVRVRVIVST